MGVGLLMALKFADLTRVMGKDPELAAPVERLVQARTGGADQQSPGRHRIFREWFDAQRENRIGDSTAADCQSPGT
jgi:hypothetical protein